ncbi:MULTISPECIES: hypothetical protein [unclassified Ochrobactrum]|jgi:hypothetical protein|uniref:hypothetical protein n=1 Tax=unclassified Ochrobactrum TaxID=239106 RepID=UPI000DD609F9|nr:MULTISPECIES: hypothetical protein [unclassified Ochrobactrum]MBQ0707300.1 hypothetical protein [Ochrobactrum sp. AP1BH01-1]
MPFRGNRYQGTYAPGDLQVLQAAYNRCCAFLDRCPTTHVDKETLARVIISTYEAGEYDPEKIAEIVAKLELARA